MTDKPSLTGTDYVRQRSLEDGILAPRLENGTTRMRLQNKKTGEWWISYCSAHQDFNWGCKVCPSGMWKYLP